MNIQNIGLILFLTGAFGMNNNPNGYMLFGICILLVVGCFIFITDFKNNKIIVEKPKWRK